MAQICGKYIKLAKFFVIEAVAKNCRERGKNATPEAAFLRFIFILKMH
jgi:hypothetical protein